MPCLSRSVIDTVMAVLSVRLLIQWKLPYGILAESQTVSTQRTCSAWSIQSVLLDQYSLSRSSARGAGEISPTDGCDLPVYLEMWFNLVFLRQTQFLVPWAFNKGVWLVVNLIIEVQHPTVDLVVNSCCLTQSLSVTGMVQVQQNVLGIIPSSTPGNQRTYSSFQNRNATINIRPNTSTSTTTQPVENRHPNRPIPLSLSHIIALSFSLLCSPLLFLWVIILIGM